MIRLRNILISKFLKEQKQEVVLMLELSLILRLAIEHNGQTLTNLWPVLLMIFVFKIGYASTSRSSFSFKENLRHKCSNTSKYLSNSVGYFLATTELAWILQRWQEHTHLTTILSTRFSTLAARTMFRLIYRTKIILFSAKAKVSQPIYLFLHLQ